MKTTTVRNTPTRLLDGYRLLSAERTKGAGKRVSMNELYIEALTRYLEDPEILAEVQRGGYYK